MKRLSTSLKIYLLLVLILAISNAFQVYFQVYQGTIPAAPLPAPLFVLALANAGIAIVLYGGLGLAGLRLARGLGFAAVWDENVNNRQRLLIPAVAGAGLGVFLILADLVFSPYNGIGRIQHPPFPASILASLSAGIGEEIIFRLFFILLWCWLFSRIIRGEEWRNRVFWIIAAVSALTFALGHLPGMMYLYGFGSISDFSPVLIFEIILLNGVISLFAAQFLRRWGFLAAAGVHFWTDIVWHVAWGLFSAVI
jgi:hypothetical protein